MSVRKKVLVLGAGLVARPLVDYLLKRAGCEVVAADLIRDKAQQIVAGHRHGRAVSLDIENEAELASFVAGSDLVVSFLPFGYHPRVARHCLDRGKHLVTSSYVSEAMRALDAAARAKKLIFLNEVGLDPGIDHMEAMRIIQGVWDRGGEIAGFVSYCGGLPAPEAKTNPFGYKFSWSPLGVLLAAKNSAKYLWEGQQVYLPADKLFDEPASLSVEGLGTFEGYPNRDSLSYLQVYGIPGARTMLRGTLRWPGWCRTFKRIKELNLLDEAEENLGGLTWKGLLAKKMGLKENEKVGSLLKARLKESEDIQVLERMEWLGLLEEKPLPPGRRTALQAMTDLLADRLRYEPGERDMIVLRHEIRAAYPGGKKERVLSTLIDFGLPGGDSAMARTVGLPAAICARLILEDKIKDRGVLIPTIRDIYAPVLRELQAYGLRFREAREAVH
ncbi:MAG: saccharopine dehydrogenase C-terminal domain-containing protein [Candidatus Aminicenantales bacterium]